MLFRSTKLLPNTATTIKEPLLHPSFDVTRTNLQTFAENQIEGDKLKMEEALQHAIESVPSKGSPLQMQAQMRGMLDRAERIGNNIVSRFWEKVPLKNPVPMSEIQRMTMRLEKELKDTPSAAPKDFIDRLMKLPPDRKSTRLNSSHIQKSRMPSSA